jgi:hypothetical protein
MPTVLCPHCTRPTTLPDPWQAPGFTCPHCGVGVPLAPPPVPAPPANPFAELNESAPSTVRVYHRDQTRMREAAATGFGSAFGRVMGEFAAACLILLVVGAGAAIVILSVLKSR